MGLFTKREFESGEYITEYRGKVIDTKYSYHKLYDLEDRMIYVNDKYCIIGNNIAAYANDCTIFDLKHYKTKKY